MKLKSSEQIAVEEVDTATGEIRRSYVTSSKTFTTKVSAERFYMTFIDMLNPLLNIGGVTDRKVLDILCSEAEFDTGKIGMYPKFKDSMCTRLGITKQTLANSLTNLKKGKFISMDRGELTINPILFWKGTLDQRAKLLENGELRVKFEMSNGK